MSCQVFSELADGWYETRRGSQVAYVRIQDGYCNAWIQTNNFEQLLDGSPDDKIFTGSAPYNTGYMWRADSFPRNTWGFSILIPLQPINEWEGDLELT